MILTETRKPNVLYSREEVDQRVGQLGREISEDYREKRL